MAPFLLVIALAQASPSLNVTVLPFDGNGTGGAKTSSVLEKDLDAINGVKLKPSSELEGGIKAAGARAFEPSVLGGLMSVHAVDVLVRGERAKGKRGSDVLLVNVYASDGSTRFTQELPLKGTPKDIARKLSSALKPVLTSWKKPSLDAPPPPTTTTPTAATPAPTTTPTTATTTPAPTTTPTPTTPASDVTATPAVPTNGEPRAHTLAIAASYSGATWLYSFDGKPAASTVNAGFYNGGGASFDVAPLAPFNIDSVVVDGDIDVAIVPFFVQGGLQPAHFSLTQIRGGAGAAFRLSLAGTYVGLHAGYRTFSFTTEEQTLNFDGAVAKLTVIPGFTLHGAAVGVVVLAPFVVGGHRLEIAARVDALPLTLYSETPDAPGKDSTTFGWSAEAKARFELGAGLFLEGGGHSDGAYATFAKQGTRLTVAGNKIVPTEGGGVVNTTAGFSLGAGFMF